jgi:hypothetical protein
MNYQLQRTTDEHRRPTTGLKIPFISIVRDPREDRGSIINWMNIKNTEQGKSLEILVFADEEKSKKVEEIKLENAHIVDYKVEFIVEDNLGLVERFNITAEKVDVNGVKFDSKWPKT